MLTLDEAETRGRIDLDRLLAAIERALVMAARGTGQVNPVVIGRGLQEGQSFSIKSGRSIEDGLVGVKIGGYWPGAEELGLPRHASTIILLDPHTGRPRALLAASALNGPRTAAAGAAAARVLMRADAAVLGVIGTGNQARHEIRAMTRIHRFERLIIAGRAPGKTVAFLDSLAAENGLPAAEVVLIDECAARADVLVTATTARAPLFDAALVRPGTHLASMGSDQRGKQELPPALLRAARLFCDLPQQSIDVGEYQHVADDVRSGNLALTAIGDVIDGRASGRCSCDEITVFDSSGIALQDLYAAACILGEDEVLTAHAHR